MTPLQGQHFGATRLAKHARTLARRHETAPVVQAGWLTRRERGPLLSRLATTRSELVAARDTLLAAASAGADVGPAGAWLLDNFFIVLEQVPEIRATMPAGYYHELPKLASGPLAGHPRVYDIIIELIAHTDGRLDEPTVALMIREYQHVTALTLGELWAIPAMLRLGYLENVRRMALRAARDVEDRARADEWVARLLPALQSDDLTGGLFDFVHRGPPLTPAFLTRFLQQIRSRRSDFTPLLWIEQWMAEDGISVEEAAQRSLQELALTQLVMANSIASLRSVASIDWTPFVEEASVTEAVLREDPSGTYARMTRASRDQYRHEVERIARGSDALEPDVAAKAVAAARAAAPAGGATAATAAAAHVGYHLSGEGRAALERELGYSGSLRDRVVNRLCAHPARFYFGAIIVATVLALGLLLQPLEVGTSGVAALGWIVLALAAALLPALDIAVAVVHQTVNAVMPPRRLARMDFARGVPPAERTAVVVPLLFPSVEAVAAALEHIEVQYLANRDPEVRFALLGDFLDAATEVVPTDAAIIAAAVAGIRALNAEYRLAGDSGGPFYLLHRPRRWNAPDGVWMGWERKRGKLVEFNALVRSTPESESAFAFSEGELEWLHGIRYVITLDADTVLPRGGAAALIGTLAHPLNRAQFDPVRGRVVRGYGILQPRVTVSLASASESRFASVYAHHAGVDPYTTAVSDVYQDLFGEGTFTGKGIYDVDAFRHATDGRFPENTLLSHDLIEGAFARAGLVSDVEVFDDYPSRYLTATRRTHRWVRGDWQLLPWLTAQVPGSAGRTPNPLSLLSRWKLVDNVRRSLSPVAVLAWFVVAWVLLPGSGWSWTASILAALSAPWIVPLAFTAARPPRVQDWRSYYTALLRDSRSALVQFGLALVLLPDQALLAGDAAVRTVARLLGSGRRMLEWQTASQTEGITANSRASVWKRMWPAVILGAGIILLVAAGASRKAGPHIPFAASVIAGTLLALAWSLAPEVAIALSRPLTRRNLVLDPEQRSAALRYAIRHWRYFERFVTAETHWLVPDNFQEAPAPIIAPRTSPTNIGLQLLSAMSAWDLGVLSRSEMIAHLERAFDTMDRLARVHGHFFNWYDLDDLRVLDPPYVSTVDSGNLAGHLLALSQGCLAAADAPVDDARLWAALDAERIHRTPSDASAGPSTWVGERILAYQGAMLDLRRRTVPSAGAESTASLLWAHQRLEATLADLADLRLGAEDDPSVSLRSAALTSDVAAQAVTRLENLARRARDYAMAMDFRIVYDATQRLFAIGYDARPGKPDESSYDLLASEARLASFVAVAKGDAPTEHWFRLGRSLSIAGGAAALVSWSGSMFEYLMPLLVMPERPFSLLDQTCHSAVQRQISYADERGVPWGISESAYNIRDRHDTYQYRAFGVPDLALKRGLANELVVAPYATALATVVDAHEALRNFTELEAHGALGPYGFYDALDFTRPDADSRVAVVRTFMAHHVGMSLVALDNALSIGEGEPQGIWQRRFMNDAAMRAAALLLDERVPRRYVPRPAQTDVATDPGEAQSRLQINVHEVDTANTTTPHVALLGGPGYSVLLTNAGSGHSRADGVDVLRWRADATRDDTGQWIYVRDLTGDMVWSVAHQPTCVAPSSYRVAFATDRVVFSRRDGPLDTRTEIVVIAGEQAEIRRVTLLNRSTVTRDIELTSYAEVVLCPGAADRSHQAFQKLFVETEWAPSGTVLASRRPRASDERWPWCAHVVAAGAEQIGEVTCETDRARFIGRGRTVREPAALDRGVSLSGTVGAVLDPIVSLRVRVRIEPGRSATVAFTTAVAVTRDAALQLADRYRDVGASARALSLARTEAEVELRDLDIAPSDVALYQELAGALIYPHEALRAPERERAAVTGGQSSLWAQGISGDAPIVLATVRSAAGLSSVRQLLVAHRYWRSKGIRADLVIVNAKPHSYIQELQDQLVAMAMASSEGSVYERPGGVFIRRADVLSADVLALMRTTACIHVLCDGVGLGEVVAANIQRYDAGTATVPAPVAAPAPLSLARPEPAPAHPDVDYPNGYGALDDAGAFSMLVSGSHVPPAPWANIIANPSIGFCVTERGGGFTWAENSYFFRLTPWFNDPVSDPCGEAIYLRDVDTGAVWNPTPAPMPATAAAGAALDYHVTHAPGVSRFRHRRHDITTELTLAVPRADAVKISRLRISNGGATARRISLTSYVEWTLAAEREQSRHQLHTRRDGETGALLAQNFYAPDFASRVAFSWMSQRTTSFTARRDHFIGRNRDLTAPAGMIVSELSRALGAGYDPCAALRCDIELAPGETRDIVILLGMARSDAEARTLIARHGSSADAATSIDDAVASWTDRLSVISARTPEPELDALFNRWSLYQAFSSRMWARSALYQSSGAYGFRDQLQDCMAFVYAEPALVRTHLLRAAGHQFVEGDVQHWWHEPSGRGVRTRFSDDLAWLPFVADQYVRVTGDTDVWDAPAPYLTMRALAPDEHEAYELPTDSGTTGSLYDHCVRALDRACTVGVHGLPLIGSGDWNDGMNRVGIGGQGESVWLAWFLADTLRRFAAHAGARNDPATAARCRARADAYAAAAEEHGWDGAWYRRAYFDDGTPLGSAANEECQIDAIAQSWAVLSGAGDPDRARTAMRSVNERLVRDDPGLLLLLTPPFDKSPHDPGYIKGYVPGVRENGAQYTHAALWTALATLRLGDGDRGGELMRMLNPLSHTRTRAAVERYRVEPYVVAADVYDLAGQQGRGGWTWYTGSASWSYRVVLEGMLGFDKRGDTLRIDPCIPSAWPGFAMDYRFGTARYAIEVRNPRHVSRGVASLTIDGVAATGCAIALRDDGARHAVIVTLGGEAGAAP